MKVLSCLTQENSRGNTERQFVSRRAEGCPHLPEDPRIRSGLRRDAGVLMFIYMPVWLRGGIRLWRSEDDMV
eukprot:6674782-Pyramimonas_sp.AAC.1